MLLKFAPLLLITVSAVENGGDQSPPKTTEVQQNPIPGSRVTSRLDIYKSLAQLHHQPRENFQPSIRSDQCILAPEDGETVNESLQHSLVEVREIIDGPIKHVISAESIESLIVFQSLLKMLSNPEQSASSNLDSQLPWREYLSESIRNLKCSVRDLCHEFGSHFKCDQEGHLNTIRLNRMGPFDHWNLLMIPNTVENIEMRRCGLTSISAWSDLKGKSLKSLRIYEPRILNFNLDGLQGTLDDLPLEDLTVGRSQLSEYFGVQRVSLSDSALPKIGEWMRSSTLVRLRIVASISRASNRRRICVDRDGNWVLD